jgi:DNA-binding protein HU-beta
MKKAEFIEAIAEKSGLTKADAEKAVKAFTDTLVEIGSDLDKITLPGFGTFEGKERAERQVRNPRTGSSMTAPPKKVLKFKASSVLDL